MKYIAVLGYGTIGSGVVDLVMQNAQEITDTAGEEIKVKYILDIRDFKGHVLSDLFVTDFTKICDDPEVSIVVEMIGGSHPAYDYTIAALRAGKHVVTSNKEVVANFGDELLAEAKKHGVHYLFEASVGGGIPIIRPMCSSIVGDSVLQISGILNGTTNYIFNRMEQDGISLSVALADAQKKGYAEANPHADISGMDAARKICILAALGFGVLADPDDIYCKGIGDISVRDMQDAARLGKRIKLIARATKHEDGKLSLSVAPQMLGAENPLYNVCDVFNGVLVSARATGDVMFYGKGAGKYPTAAAVLSDIIAIAMDRAVRVPRIWERTAADALADVAGAAEEATPFYLSFKGSEAPSFATATVSEEDGVLAVLTKPMTESALEQACQAEKIGICSAIRLDAYEG